VIPWVPTSKFAALADRNPKILKETWSGKRINTVRILKKSWTTAAEKPFLNSERRDREPIDTIVFVTDVPIFEPIIMGIAPDTVRVPPATIPTTMDVTVDELCTRLVTNIPIKRPANGEAVV
jgi:hypothetical protein